MSGVRTDTQSPAAASVAPPLSPGDLDVSLLPCVTLQVFEDSCQPLQDCPPLLSAHWFLDWQFVALHPL